MRILIAEDDKTSRLFMEKYLSRHGRCDVALNGVEVIDMVMDAIDSNDYYDLICLDIMMPKVDGLKALKTIRTMENNIKNKSKSAKVIMTTALNDSATVEEAYSYGCEAYLWKPIDVKKFDELLEKLELI